MSKKEDLSVDAILNDLPRRSRVARQGVRGRAPKKKGRFKVGDIVTTIWSVGHYSGKRIPAMTSGTIKEAPGTKYLVVFENGLEGWYEDENFS